MGAVPKNPPESMQHHLRQRLKARAEAHWPQLTGVDVRFRAGFAYVDGELDHGERLPLCRLRFTGVLHTWGFALHLASRGGYADNVPLTLARSLAAVHEQQRALEAQIRRASVGWLR